MSVMMHIKNNPIVFPGIWNDFIAVESMALREREQILHGPDLSRTN
jgi:hypothetical protein